MQCLKTTLSYIRQQMFRLLIAHIKAMFDDNMISIRAEMFSIFKLRIKAIFDRSIM